MYLSITFTSESSVIMPRNPFLEMVKQSAEKNKINKWFGKLECKVMNELVKNGNEEFRNIDRKLGLESGHTNYIFYKLKTKGIINRTTITIKPIGFKFNGIFIMKINNYKLFSESRQKWLLELISKRGIINKYLFAEDIGIPDGVLHITPIFNEHDIASTDNILSNISGSRTESLVVTNIILGEFCYRNFDPTYTNIYDILTKNYGLKLGQKEKYE
jgi:DNA-binding Lrp family transcriptional regulator